MINLAACVKRKPTTGAKTATATRTPEYKISGFWLVVDGKKTCRTPPLLDGQIKNQVALVGNTIMVNGRVYDPAKEGFV